ncbi:hypothetical protein R6Q57_018584 [Mikania cordata]
MSMNKFVNLAKQHRVIGPKVIMTKSAKANYINVKAKRQLLLADEDDQTFHEGDLQLQENMVLFFLFMAQQIKIQSITCQEMNHNEAFQLQIQSITCQAMNHNEPFQLQIQSITSQAMNHNEAFQLQIPSITSQAMNHNEAFQLLIQSMNSQATNHNEAFPFQTLFDIDVENSNICKVIDSYMARAWRAHRAKLRAYFKENGGSKDLTKIKASPPYNISKEDWEYLCDMWCDAKFLETAKRKVKARQNRKTESRNGSKSTIRYHLEHGHGLYSSSGQFDTWRLTHWEGKKGWISKDAAVAYEDMIKLRKQHSMESMSDKLILEKVLGRRSVHLHGWGRDPTIGSNTTGANQKLNQVT